MWNEDTRTAYLLYLYLVGIAIQEMLSLHHMVCCVVDHQQLMADLVLVRRGRISSMAWRLWDVTSCLCQPVPPQSYSS